MNSYLKNVDRIEFVITYSCSGRCKHCSVGDHTNRPEHIDALAASEAVRAIARMYDIRSIMTFGGEPLLYPDAVCAVHLAAKEMNIEKRQVITNGYFSKDRARIAAVAKMLEQSGVNDVLLSVDSFHAECIPIEYVKMFALEMKKTSVRLRTQPAWLVSCEDDNPYNRITKDLLRDFSDMGIEQNYGNVVFAEGNAMKYLSEYFDPAKEIVNPYVEDPRDLHTICFEPDGCVLDGNIYRQDICDIIYAYHPDAKV